MAQLLQLIGQGIALFLKSCFGLRHGELLIRFSRVELTPQLLNHCVLGRLLALEFNGELRLGQFDGGLLIFLRKFQAVVELLIKLAIAHLLQDVGIARLVNFEGFAAVGTNDIVHVQLSLIKNDEKPKQ